MIKYTVLREDGYYPDGSYNMSVANRGMVCSTLNSARLWDYKRPAEKYVGKFGGKVIEVRVTYERVT